MLFIMEGIDLAGVLDSDFQGIQINFARPAGFANLRGAGQPFFPRVEAGRTYLISYGKPDHKIPFFWIFPNAFFEILKLISTMNRKSISRVGIIELLGQLKSQITSTYPTIR